METKVYRIKDIEKDFWAIDEAAALIRQGQVVAFPTETVYGLGANALDGQAVDRIFKAKGRPNDNPLIVHVSKAEDIEPLVLEVPPETHALIEAFWPGPYHHIEEIGSSPHETTAGLTTVALRMPNHPIALALIERSEVPLAAPSANTSGRLSPTMAQHVLEDLSGAIPMILDGIYPCQVGLESTVLDMSGENPVILRPGGITPGMLREVLGHVDLDESILKPADPRHSPRSPGMKYKHYAPRAQVIIFKGSSLKRMADKINEALDKYLGRGLKVGILATDETIHHYGQGRIISMGSREEPATIATGLYTSLREFDKAGVDIILAEWVEEKEEGLAIMNRMIRAAGFQVVDTTQ